MGVVLWMYAYRLIEGICFSFYYILVHVVYALLGCHIYKFSIGTFVWKESQILYNKILPTEYSKLRRPDGK